MSNLFSIGEVIRDSLNNRKPKIEVQLKNQTFQSRMKTTKAEVTMKEKKAQISKESLASSRALGMQRSNQRPTKSHQPPAKMFQNPKLEIEFDRMT